MNPQITRAGSVFDSIFSTKRAAEPLYQTKAGADLAVGNADRSAITRKILPN